MAADVLYFWVRVLYVYKGKKGQSGEEAAADVLSMLNDLQKPDRKGPVTGWRENWLERSAVWSAQNQL